MTGVDRMLRCSLGVDRLQDGHLRTRSLLQISLQWLTAERQAAGMNPETSSLGLVHQISSNLDQRHSSYQMTRVPTSQRVTVCGC